MSFPATQELPLTWLKIAETVFNKTVGEEFVKTNGLYNQMFVDCSYQEQLMKKPSKLSKLTGDCQYLFDYVLTNKGVCHSFNSWEQSKIWQPSKIVNSFQQIVRNKHPDRKLGGTGSNQGMTLHQFVRLYHRKIFSNSKDHFTTEKVYKVFFQGLGLY